MIFTYYWKVFVLNFSVMINTVFFSIKTLMEGCYLLGVFGLSMIFQDLGNMVFHAVWVANWYFYTHLSLYELYYLFVNKSESAIKFINHLHSHRLAGKTFIWWASKIFHCVILFNVHCAISNNRATSFS